jgi:hypothetical protein
MDIEKLILSIRNLGVTVILYYLILEEQFHLGTREVILRKSIGWYVFLSLARFLGQYRPIIGTVAKLARSIGETEMVIPRMI